jgi:hypothetical protein
MVKGIPVAEVAVEGFSDWRVIEGIERLWNAAASETPSE